MGTQEKTVQTDPRCLDTEAAAKYLAISPSMVAKLVRAERLRPTRIGRRVVFDRKELDRFILACQA